MNGQDVIITIFESRDTCSYDAYAHSNGFVGLQALESTGTRTYLGVIVYSHGTLLAADFIDMEHKAVRI